MAKKSTDRKKDSGKQPKEADASKKQMASQKMPAVISDVYLPYLIIFLFSTAVYFNTLWDKYALDDRIVLTHNQYTLKGFAGIRDIMTHDAFEGILGETGIGLVSGGRYRPLSIATMAAEVGIFGLNPAISHGINVLLFSLTCLLLYHILRRFISPQQGGGFYMSIPFIATLLFAGHPIHTEAVANIKGRDEIMGLLFALLALHASMLYVSTRHIIHLVWGALVFSLALLSKENTVTYLAVIPLTYYFFTHAKLKDYAFTLIAYLIPVLVFLFLRSHYTKASLWAESPEILNNPFAYLTKDAAGYAERYATVIITFLLYFKLLISPYPLSHDYYYNQIPFVGATDPIFILSVIVNLWLLAYAYRGFKSKSLYSYAILYYFITFSIVSNLVINTGTLLNERLVYMPSVGFCLLLAYLLLLAKERFSISTMTTGRIVVVILVLYSVGTFSRNIAWHDDTTLVLTDVKKSPNSARVQYMAGQAVDLIGDQNIDSMRREGQLQKIADMLEMNEDVSLVPDSLFQKQLYGIAMQYINRSLSIYPKYLEAWDKLGNVSYKANHDLHQAVGYYLKAKDYSNGNDFNAWNDMGIKFLDNNLPALAKENFIKAIRLKPGDLDCRSNLALVYYQMGNMDSAKYWLIKTLELKPNDADVNYKLGRLYLRDSSQLGPAIKYISQAIALDPGVSEYYGYLGLAYNVSGRYNEAIGVLNACLLRFPYYAPAVTNIITAYRSVGDSAKAKEYEARLAAMVRR
jgi:tetratricopeptide (TPR) repeat protein